MYLIRIIFSFLKDREYRQLLWVSGLILIIGTLSYHYIEGWSWVDAAYFSVITLTTIGYGDFSPQTTFGKIFTIFYILIGVGVVLGFINTIYLHYKNRKIYNIKTVWLFLNDQIKFVENFPQILGKKKEIRTFGTQR